MVGSILAGAAFLADAAVIAATHSWLLPVSSPVVFAVLGITWVLSVAAFLALRRRDRGPGGGGDSDPAPEPEPPWWPDFERQFRDYTRRGPRPAHRSRPPVLAGRR